MSTAKDIAGQRFGKLVALHRVPGPNKLAHWLFQCDCGNTKRVSGANARSGQVTSCGCVMRESVRARSTSHGHTRVGQISGEWRAWRQARSRCFYPKDKSFEDYAGRGITMCAEWAESFEAFFADMGPKPTPQHTLDRIDNDRNYEPGNCRWATRAVQTANRRPTGEWKPAKDGRTYRQPARS